MFVGHGTPFSVIDPNVWTEQWGRVGPTLPAPVAILMVSAHWLTRGAAQRQPAVLDRDGLLRARRAERQSAHRQPVIREIGDCVPGVNCVVPRGGGVAYTGAYVNREAVQVVGYFALRPIQCVDMLLLLVRWHTRVRSGGYP
jgi:hypothetical protein